MQARDWRRCLAALGLAMLTGALGALGRASATIRSASGRTLLPTTQFFVPVPPSGAVAQETELVRQGHFGEAARVGRMLATPQAVWFNGTTGSGAPQSPEQAGLAAAATMAAAAAEGRVPVIVVYDIPGRDCEQYSAGGATDAATYDAWVSGLARGLGSHQVVVILEPDSLGNLPSDCLANYRALNSTNYPFSDAERFAELNDAVNVLEADPNASVYLDGTNSAWQPVGRIAERLVEAGVLRAQGFFLNVSNYQYTSNNIAYGTWISQCVAYGTKVSNGSFAACPDQYGGPETNGQGRAMDNFAAWDDAAVSTKNPLSRTVVGIDSRYASLLGSVAPSTHFVIDTSRNGDGPNEMASYAAAPYRESTQTVARLMAGNWCNPPGAGLGRVPTAHSGVRLVDAYLWVKIAGESDGQCDSARGVRAWDYGAYRPEGWPTTAAAQSLFDPLWGQDDPASGAWFPAEALQLVADARPSPSSPGNAAPAGS